MRAVVGRAPRPPGISSAVWPRTQRHAREVFPKSMAHRTRPFIASTHSHGKLEIHIVRSLSLRLDKQGLGGVRGCAKQLGVFPMLWSSAGADVQHLVIACCRLVWRSAGEAARELFGRRPSYRSWPRPPAGRSRRERTPIWARCGAASRRVPPSPPSTAVLWRAAPPMSPLATQVHTGRTGGLSAAKGHRGRAWEPRGTSPGAYSALAGPFLTIHLLYTTNQNKTTEVYPPPVIAP